MLYLCIVPISCTDAKAEKFEKGRFALATKTKNWNKLTNRRNETWGQAFKKHYWLYLMLIPGLAYFIIFCYKPMGGILMAFEDYEAKLGFFRSPWIGFENFERFFNYRFFWRLIRNTVWLNVTSLCWSMPITLIFALLVNELRNGPFRKVVTTVSYMPHFVSTVIVVSIFFQFLTPNGVINTAIESMGGAKAGFLTDPKWFRTVYNTIGIWQETGWSAVIYIAALTGIDQSLYEAAHIDGAGKLRQCWYISLPGIASTISVMLIMSLGSILASGTDRILLLYTERTYETADVIGTYVYRIGLIDNDYGYSTAVNLFQSVIGIIMITISNSISKRLSETSLF